MQSRRERADRIQSAVNCTVALVHEHYGEPLVLATIADDLAISIFSLSRAFKRAMHVSFRTYLLHVRITTAQTLLRETDRPITEIAQLVGFGDLPRFDKMFKQLVGTSPVPVPHSRLAGRGNFRSICKKLLSALGARLRSSEPRREVRVVRRERERSW